MTGATSVLLFNTTLLSQHRISRNSPLHHQSCSEFHENPTSGFVAAITSKLATQYRRRPALVTQKGGMLRKERLQFCLPLTYLNISLKFQTVNFKPTLRLSVDLH
jgi:hypothetical protein